MTHHTVSHEVRTLGSLSDPFAHNAQIDIAGFDVRDLLRFLETMLRIRTAEECIGQWVEEKKALCPCHLGIGQEAIGTGVASALTADDRLFGTHRSHSQFLALGGELTGLLAEVLGKAAGCSKGMGGSMHLVDQAHGFMGSVPIVGATIPLAVGAALAAKMDGRDAVAVAFFGDGASEEGVLHECLNLAARYELPMLFVCENNMFSSHMHISLRQPCDAIARFADAHCITASIIDGNDVCAVARTAQTAVARARRDRQPYFIEAVTYRWRGHVGPREDEDVGVRRKDDLHVWKQRDPILRLRAGLQAAGLLSDAAFDQLAEAVRQDVAAAALVAEQAPYPPATQLLDPVFYTEAADRARN